MTALSTTFDPADLILDASDIVVEYRMPTSRTNTLKETVIQRLAGRHQVIKTQALKGVTLKASRGECVALIGHNGCGKSTLLKVIAGILKPARGLLTVQGRIAPLIELGAGFDPELTGQENVYLACSLMGLTRSEVEARLPSIREFAELGEYFDAPVKTYSSGMYMRLGFACTTAIDAHLLLIDEILAVGDENFQRKCFARLQSTRAAGVTIVLVTHDLGVVRKMADRVLVLDHGHCLFEGGPVEAIDFYLQRMADEREAKRSVAEKREEERLRRLAEAGLSGASAGGAAQILDVHVAGTDGLSSTRLTTGEPWTLTFDIRIDRGFTEAPVVGYAIHSVHGQRVFGGNTRVHVRPDGSNTDVETFKTPGYCTVAFEFGTLPLASGRYTVVAAIHDHKIEKTVDLKSQAVQFEAMDPHDHHNFNQDLVAHAALDGRVQVGRV